ncbi:Asp-tRNA(Asn)/Glu-tRNA(Gln) amidotransferase subunit GatA, partial [Candidatus Parcubacteria bacterium]|nr:Asp-tRNA(Asn)/Glu-tRNA(Gln) amidotransferase subunit GatA [Candidatus Parcubacteria bacterium]
TTVSDAVPKYSEEIKKSVKGMKVGVPKEYFELEGMEDETKEIVMKQIQDLKNLGVELVDVSLPYIKYAVAVYYIVVPSEDSSNMGRLDGIRYGVQAEGKNLYDIYAKSRAQGFPEEVKRRIMIGTYALSAGYYDAYYKKAQKVRTLIIKDFERVFESVDCIVAPTSPFPAFKIGEKKDDVLAMYLADVCTCPASVAGIPGLSVPSGNTKLGLPVGLQIMGPRLGEAKVLQLGHAIQIS